MWCLFVPVTPLALLLLHLPLLLHSFAEPWGFFPQRVQHSEAQLPSQCNVASCMGLYATATLFCTLEIHVSLGTCSRLTCLRGNVSAAEQEITCEVRIAEERSNGGSNCKKCHIGSFWMVSPCLSQDLQYVIPSRMELH